MVRISRRIAAGAAGGVLLGAATGLLAPVAADADVEVPSGAYQETDESGTYTWDFTPCGTTCTSATSSDDESVGGGIQFQLSNGTWTGTGPMTWHCTDGSTGPAQITYTFDAATLSGNYVVTSTADACGKPAGTVGDSYGFSLAKVE